MGLRYLFAWRVLGVVFIAIVVAVSLAPYSIRSPISNIDKLYHALTYAGLMYWYVQIYPRKHHPWLLFGLVLMGVLIEGLQSLTSYRKAELLDVAANSVGVIVGWAVFQTRLGRLLTAVDRSLVRYRELPDK